METRLGTHDLGAHGWLRLVVAAALVLVLILTLEASPTAGASGKACRVTNTDTGKVYHALQAAVDAALPGQRLTVNGTCHGPTTIDKDLSIRGIRTARADGSILDGDASGTVLTVLLSTVLLKDLTIEGGDIPWSAAKPRFAGGITNREGVLTLRDVVVHHNRGKKGGGLYNSGSLVVAGSSVIKRNRPGGGSDAGAYNLGTLTIAASSLVRGIDNRGTLTLSGHATVRGVRNARGGTVTLNDASSIRYGLQNDSGMITMNDRSVIAKEVLNESGIMTMNDESRISGSSMSGITNRSIVYGLPAIVVVNDLARIVNNGRMHGLPGYYASAGVFNIGGSLTLNDAALVRGNRNWGVYNIEGGALTMSGTSRITGNHGLGKRGGGVHAGTLTGVTCGPGGNVYGNTPDDCYIESP